MNATMKKAEATITASDLARLGFAPEPEAAPRRRAGRRQQFAVSARQGEWFTKGNIRVVLHGEDGTEVFAFATTVAHGLLDWSMRFDGNVPARVIRAAIFSATEGG